MKKLFGNYPILSVLALLAMGDILAAKENPLVKLPGILESGRNGAGVESTGIILHTGRDGDISELELVLPDYLQKAVEHTSGKAVEISGRQTILKGVETGERRALKVEKITFYSQAALFQGQLSIGPIVLGSEGTGYLLTVDKFSEYILFLKQQDKEALKELDGKKIKLKGVKHALYRLGTGERAIIVEELILN